MAELNLTQIKDIAAQLCEAEPSLSQDTAMEIVVDIERSYREHGSSGGGNKHGLLGTWVAMQIDKADRRG